MKKHTFAKLICSLLAAAALAFCLVGCANSSGLVEASDGVSYSSSNKILENTGSIIQGTSSTEISSENVISESDRKIITTYDITMQTLDYDKLLTEIGDKVSELGGYIETSKTYGHDYVLYDDSYGYSSSNRSASLGIRVPTEEATAFDEFLQSAGNVTNRGVQSEDVTLTYVDTEARLESYRAELATLQDMLSQATNVDELITIQSRISDVTYQIETYEKQLRSLDNQIDYTYFEIYVSEVQTLTPVEEQTVWEQIVEGFQSSLADLGDGLVEFFIGFLSGLPYIIFFGLIALVVIFIVRGTRKRKARKAAAAQMGMNQNPQA